MTSANGVPGPDADGSADFSTQAYDSMVDPMKDGDAERAWTYFSALDDWLRSGRPLPDPWHVPQVARTENSTDDT